HITALKGKFLFGDIPTGRLFYIDVHDIKQGKIAEIKEWRVSFNGSIKSLKELCSNDRVDLHFGKDANGELYIMTKADGKIYKINKYEKVTSLGNGNTTNAGRIDFFYLNSATNHNSENTKSSCFSHSNYRHFYRYSKLFKTLRKSSRNMGQACALWMERAGLWC